MSWISFIAQCVKRQTKLGDLIINIFFKFLYDPMQVEVGGLIVDNVPSFIFKLMQMMSNTQKPLRIKVKFYDYNNFI